MRGVCTSCYFLPDSSQRWYCYDVIFIAQLQCGADLTDSFVLAGLYFEIIFPLQYNTIVHLTHRYIFLDNAVGQMAPFADTEHVLNG